MNLLLIIPSIIFFIGIILFVIFKHSSDNKKQRSLILDSCLSDKQCDIGTHCVFNPDYGKKMCIPIGKDYCNIRGDAKNLLKCTTDTDCSNCINGHETGNEGIILRCVNVYDGSMTGATGSTGSVDLNLYKSLIQNLTPGNYCLPKMAKGDECNRFTSDTILTRTNDGAYKWSCICKDSNRLFQKNITDGDCTNQIACNNGKYPLYVPELKTDKTAKTCDKDTDCGDGVCWDKFGNKYGDKYDATSPLTGYCYVKWTSGVESNPFNGYCKCDPGKYSYKTVDAAGNVILECIEDTCSAVKFCNNDSSKKCNNDVDCGAGNKCIYTKDSGHTVITDISEDLTEFKSDSCICPPGYIRCPDDIPIGDDDASNVASIRLLCLDKPRCLPDPCITKICSNNSAQACNFDADCGVGNKCIDNTFSYCENSDTLCGSDKDCGEGEGKCVTGPSHYNKKNIDCVCNTTLGFNNIKNEYSYAGYNCTNLCANNPCGNRGTCWVDKEEINPSTSPPTYRYIQKCKDCKYPFTQENTNQCREFVPVGCKNSSCTVGFDGVHCL